MTIFTATPIIPTMGGYLYRGRLGNVVWLFFLALLSAGFGLYGCATRPDIEEQPKVRMINKTGRKVAEVFHRPCGTEDWRPIENASIMPGGGLSLTLSEDCEDLLATFDGGESAGLQKSVRRGIPLKWLLY